MTDLFARLRDADVRVRVRFVALARAAPILLGDNWSRGGADSAIAESLQAVNQVAHIHHWLLTLIVT